MTGLSPPVTLRGMPVQVSDVDLLRRRVLNVFGHELRTPVSTLSGLARELETCDDDGKRSELAAAVARSARRLDRLVDDLLLAAGITTLVPVEEAQAVDLVATARSLWTGPGDAISGCAVALARPQVARRALTELLDNATIYGEAPFSITAWATGGRAIVEIANGGPAISDEELALALELFFRGERAVTTQAGLGLGLAVARTLVEADGGDIALRAGPAGGVIAHLELPAP